MIPAKPGLNKKILINVGIWLMIALFPSWPAVAPAGIDADGDNGIRVKKVHITADRLVSDGNANYIRFSGNVTTVYDDTTIRSDEMEVFYQSKGEDADRMAQENIEKIVATGQVFIQLGDRTAYCDRAVYTAATATIVLTGENTRIQSGADYITGKKITIDRNRGRVVVDGGPEQRVNAVFTTKNPENAADDGVDEDHDNTGLE